MGNGVAFLVSAAGLVNEIIASDCSSPQTAELNADERAPTLMKWVNIGLVESVLFHRNRSDGRASKHSRPIVAGGAPRRGDQVRALLHAKDAGSRKRRSSDRELLMANLTGPEIAATWILNGGSAKAAETWAGIALSQSGGSTTAVYNTIYTNLPGYSPVLDHNSPEYSIGLWQINQVAHPQYSTAYLADVNNQAKAAIAIANNGTDLSPWQGDPVANAAMANGGYATLAQINQALATEGKSYGGGAPVSQSTLQAGIAAGTATAAAGIGAGGGCANQQTFTFRRPGGCCDNVTMIRGAGLGIINECQAQGFVGFMLMVAGGIVVIAGMAVLFKGIGLAPAAVKAVQAVPGVKQVQASSARATRTRNAAQSSQLRMTEREHASGLRMTETEHRASAARLSARPRSRDINDDEPFPLAG